MTQRVPWQPIPIYVIAGVLGSGKTTLMAKLARHCMDAKRRVGLVVNDIGDLGVDGMALAETGWPYAAVDSLNGECACCSDGTDLEDVLDGMREMKRELLLFETTGVADAADMLSQLSAHHLRRLVQSPRLVSVIDLTRYPGGQRRNPLVQRQIALADAVILGKADLVDEARIADAQAAIEAENPRVPMLRQPLRPSELDSILDAKLLHADALDQALVNGPPGHPLPHTLTLSLAETLKRDLFEAFLNDLPPTILRAKGFVALDVEPSLHLFQYVEPGFVHLTPFHVARRPGVVMAPTTTAPYGVFIGTAIDEPVLRAGLAECAAP